MLANLQDVSSAPGPRGIFPAVANLFAMRRDLLGFLTRVGNEHGDIARFRLGPYRVCLLNAPSLIRDALITAHNQVTKYHLQRKILSQIEGNGLLASEGADWQSRRQLLNPVFQGAEIDKGAKIASDHAEAWCGRVDSGRPVEVVQEMTDLAMGIMMHAFFGSGLDHEIARMRPIVRDLSTTFITEMRWNMIPLRLLPTRHNRRKQAAISGLNALVDQIVAREAGSGSGSLISLLLEEIESGESEFDTTDARDEVVTMFNSGHDTTAAGLVWTWYLLGRHRESMEQMHEEVLGVVGDGPVRPEHVAKLTYTRAVIQESMRLYPPGWAMFARVAEAPITVGSWRVPQGHWLMVYPWVTHRDPRFFQDPLEFDPQRFLTGERMQKRAYIPFGVGPHACIGANLAMTQSIVIMATIARQFGFELEDPSAEATPDPLLSIWPRGGLRGKLTPMR